ncbi:MAG: substrate-binding domain-containing protein, partial [Imperialibacter sp.]
DNFDISFQGTEHLIQQGCKRIAFVAGPLHLFNSRNRLNGYLEALKANNIPVVESLIVQANYQAGHVQQYTRHLFDAGEAPDGIFAINDISALEMMHILKMRGLQIPRDVAVLGFNNEVICDFVEPTLSSIEHPAFDMGVAATRILLKQISSKEITQQKELIKSRLVIRESSRRY